MWPDYFIELPDKMRNGLTKTCRYFPVNSEEKSSFTSLSTCSLNYSTHTELYFLSHHRIKVHHDILAKKLAWTIVSYLQFDFDTKCSQIVGRIQDSWVSLSNIFTSVWILLMRRHAFIFPWHLPELKVLDWVLHDFCLVINWINAW